MRRKEIFLKKLSFIISLILIVSFVLGKGIPLPKRSEFRMVYGQRNEEAPKNEIIIKQEGKEIHITFLSDAIVIEKYGTSQGIREGVISILEFKSFWDSLNTFGFWKLKEGYSVPAGPAGAGEIAGFFSVSFVNEENIRITKKVGFNALRFCPEECKKVYELVQVMKKFAQNPPDLDSLLKFENKVDELWEKTWYQELANAEIRRIKDPKYLDTLLILLPKENKFSDGIINALRNIGDRKAAPVLYRFLEHLELAEPPTEVYIGLSYLMPENLIVTTLHTLVSLEGRGSIKTLKKYLDKKYDTWVRFSSNMMLIQLNDYSALKDLISFLKENYFNGYIEDALRRISKDKRVISAIIKALKEEMNAKELNDKRISGLINGLPVLTGQYFTYKPSDSLVVKKEAINKWINWWKENKDKFK